MIRSPLESSDKSGDRDSRTLFAGNLPLDVTAAELKALSNDILNVRIPQAKGKRKRTIKFAFLEFSSQNKAEENYKILQSKKLRGQPIKVEFTRQKCKHSNPSDQQKKENLNKCASVNFVTEEDADEALTESKVEESKVVYSVSGDLKKEPSEIDSDSSEADVDERKQDDVEDSEDSSESESESDDSSDDKNEEDFDHQWEELRNEAPDTDDITRRIAVCNMDWDRIRAVDLLACFNSFKPPDGYIHSVKIYPSEFGLKRMEEEKLKGPSELVETVLPFDEEEVEDKKGSKYHREKLRQYQIGRLKYYYAVVDCDSPETANSLYEQLNGMEYESSSVRFDLRFIPDDMVFEHKPTSVADKVPSEYKPRLFVTSALQQVKVDLTWDETDPKRREFFQKVFTDIDSVQNDIKEYLASGSSESEEEVETTESEPNKNLKNEERIAKYRELIKAYEEKEKKEKEEKYHVEVTWDCGLKEKTEEKVKEKLTKDSLTPFEEMVQKKKDKRKTKKKESQKLQQDESSSSDDDDDDSSDNTTKENIKNKKLAELALISSSKEVTESEVKNKKRKKDKTEDLEGFEADMSDPRFSAMFTSSLFNMVPSDQRSKNTHSKLQKTGKFKKSSKKGEALKNSKRARHH